MAAWAEGHADVETLRSALSRDGYPDLQTLVCFAHVGKKVMLFILLEKLFETALHSCCCTF